MNLNYFNQILPVTVDYKDLHSNRNRNLANSMPRAYNLLYRHANRVIMGLSFKTSDKATLYDVRRDYTGFYYLI